MTWSVYRYVLGQATTAPTHCWGESYADSLQVCLQMFCPWEELIIEMGFWICWDVLGRYSTNTKVEPSRAALASRVSASWTLKAATHPW